jgi:hypothetical protein
MSNPIGYAGRGTVIGFSALPLGSPPVYTPMTQLSKFERSGSKTEFDDITCLDSPGVNKFPSPVAVDNGKYQGEGVFNPQDPTQQLMMSSLQAMAQLGYKITLIDGTTLVGICYIAEFMTPKVDVYKNNRFSFSIDIFGVEVLTPQGGSPINE